MAVCLYLIDLSVHLIKKYTLAGNKLGEFISNNLCIQRVSNVVF